jgi:hypothetical protein
MQTFVCQTTEQPIRSSAPQVGTSLSGHPLAGPTIPLTFTFTDDLNENRHRKDTVHPSWMQWHNSFGESENFTWLEYQIHHESLIKILVQMSLKHHEIRCLGVSYRNIADSTCHIKRSWPDNCIERFDIQKTVENKAGWDPKFYEDGCSWINSTEEPGKVSRIKKQKRCRKENVTEDTSDEDEDANGRSHSSCFHYEEK